MFAVALLAASATGGVVGCDGGESARQKNDQVTQPAVVPAPRPGDGSALAGALTQPSAGPQTRPAELADSYLFLREVPPPQWSGQDLVVPALPDPENMGEATRFAGARLRLLGKGEGPLVAVLFSNDPKEAITQKWQGNRYYFRMPLRVSDASKLDQSPYRLRVSRDDADETTEGVYLAGDRYHLEPIDLSVEFTPIGSQVWAVSLGGLFKLYDNEDVAAAPRWFFVQGIVHAPR
jgi:hypothetical protein